MTHAGGGRKSASSHGRPATQSQESKAEPVGRFPKSQHVRKRSEFQEIQSNGRRLSTARFILLLYARAPADSARLGITASRKAGISVVRTRAKRLIREAFRATRDLWAPDIDLVVIVRRWPSTSCTGDVVDEWRAVSSAIRKKAAEARKDRENRLA